LSGVESGGGGDESWAVQRELGGQDLLDTDMEQLFWTEDGECSGAVLEAQVTTMRVSKFETRALKD
jgi:hypothetical protein